MVQQIIRRCDFVEKGAACGEVVEGQAMSFSLGKKDYEIDLCEKHAAKFEAVLAPYMEGAVPSNRFGRPPTVSKTKTQTYNSQEIREWLASQGRTVNPKGRIPNVLVDEYMAAQGK